jgi:hypothetical protein
MTAVFFAYGIAQSHTLTSICCGILLLLAVLGIARDMDKL